MKKSKIIWIALFTMIFIVMGCSPEAAPIDPEAGQKADLEGMNFIFASNWAVHYWPAEYEAETGSSFSVWGDAIKERYAKIEEEYNVTLNFKFMENNDTGMLLTAAMSGSDDTPDVVDAFAKLGYVWYNANILTEYDGLESIDINDSEKWGSKAFLQYGNFDGLQYGIYPYYWPNKPEMAGALFVNFDNLKKFGFHDINPHELQEQREWTWDNFTEILKTVNNPDGENIKALAVADGDEMYLKSVIFSNGGEIVKFDESANKYVSAISDPASLEAIEYASSLYSENLASAIKMPEFVKGEAMFATAEVWYAMSINPQLPAEALNDFTLLNFPTGPSAKNANEISQYVHSGRRLFWLTSVSPNNPEDVAFLMNKIYEPLRDDGSYTWKDVLKNSYFHHEEGFNDYVRSLEDIKYDYSIQLIDIATQINNAFNKAAKGSASAFEAAESIRELIDTELDKTMNK